MKTLPLTGTFTDFAGKEIQGLDGPITHKDILIQCIGTFFTSPDAKENIQAYEIGSKLYAAEESIDLEDADFKLLNKAVDKMIKDQRYSATLVAQIAQFMESVKE